MGLKKSSKKLLFVSLAAAGLLPAVAKALNLIPSDCLSPKASGCGLEDLVQLFVNAYSIAIVYLGSIALLFIVIGGFIMLTSHGRQDRVDLGKQIISHTIIGVVIVMTAFLVVNIIQTQVFKVTDEEYLLTSGSDCQGKPDGTKCSLLTGAGSDAQYQGVFACVSGQCAMSLCEYGWRHREPWDTSGYWREVNGEFYHKSCMNANDCQPGTIKTGECPGGKNVVCCFLKDEYLDDNN